MSLPEEYIIQKFFSYNGGVKYLKHQHVYQGSCYICKEGNSWLKKKRCYYLTKEDAICCHNCGWYSKPLKWIMEVTGSSYAEVMKEAKTFEFIPKTLEDTVKVKPKIAEKLPHDSINLLDKSQVMFYKDVPVVRTVINLMMKRRLATAINRPKGLYVSLTDKVHANRLILPFYNEVGDVVFYQSRGVLDTDIASRPKYISKIGGDKTLFNIDKITNDFDSIFIFEGPINSFFCINGVAVGGIQEKSYNNYTPMQAKQIQKYPLHRKIWVLDSQWIDTASANKSQRLIESGESVFIWPKDKGTKYKDFNDIAIAEGIDKIDPQFVFDNTHQGLNAKLKLAEILRVRGDKVPLH